MSDLDNQTFKFFVDQVIRQYQELKADLRNEIGSLKEDLAHDFHKQDMALVNLKEEIHDRFVEVETAVESLQKFKWYLLGASSLVFLVLDIIIRVGEAYLTR